MQKIKFLYSYPFCRLDFIEAFNKIQTVQRTTTDGGKQFPGNKLVGIQLIEVETKYLNT